MYLEDTEIIDDSEKIGNLIDWTLHDAESDELLDVYRYVTGQSDLDLYRNYIERNMERINEGWVPICFVEFCESEEIECEREALNKNKPDE